MPGDLAGCYVIRELLDRGGCGIIYAGVHRESSQPVAIKVLRSELLGSAEMMERFIREASAVKQIQHPNIVRTYDGGTLPDGRPFLVMELLEGKSLRELRKQRGAFSAEETLEVLEPVCQALEAVHAAGYIHRDLKSSNIIVSDDRQRITLLDFGIAKLIHPAASQSGLTSVGHPMGTPHSMAPEQIAGSAISPSTDVYALGILAFELLTARLPFESESRSEIEHMHLRVEPPRPSRDAPVSSALDEVVMRCLAKSQYDRYPSPSAFSKALRDAVAAESRGDERAPSEERQAVGIFIEVQPRGSSYDEMDDHVLDALMDTLDAAESELCCAGLTIPIHTSNSLLGAMLVPSDPRAASAASRDALTCARRLCRTLALDPVAAESLQVAMTVHLDRVRVTGSNDSPALGGPLLQITEWPKTGRAQLGSPQREQSEPTLQVTRSFLERFAEDAHSES